MHSSTSDVRCGLVFMLASLFLFSFSNPAAAGQGTAASIIGQVTDQSGAVLPGVTVTATSPALQVPQVTDGHERGGRVPRWRRYRLVSIEVTFELSGFRPVQRQDVRLTVGFTARARCVAGAGHSG